MNTKYPYIIKNLPYSYDALEPYIDTEIMKLHHDKHYRKYVESLNDTLKNYPSLQNMYLVDILQNPSVIPLSIRKKVIDNGGGVYNHELFFNIMRKPNMGNQKIDIIINQFDSMENLENTFKYASLNVFGSGWVWLVKSNDGKLLIISTPNQNTPLHFNLTPILGLDLWEHAYYKKYENRRNEYIDNWFNVINWDEVENIYKKTSK